MLGQPTLAMYQLSRYYQERVAVRKATVAKNVHELCKVVHDVLKEVEAQEPRFISTMVESQGRYEGVYATSPTEFEVLDSFIKCNIMCLNTGWLKKAPTAGIFE